MKQSPLNRRQFVTKTLTAAASFAALGTVIAENGLSVAPPGQFIRKVKLGVVNALLTYWGKSQLHSTDDAFAGTVENLYEAGAKRNIATFYENITDGHFENETVERSVDGVLDCILGREAATRRVRLTMEQLLKENRKLEVDLTGLKT
ncbi:MAG: hypothetical protein ABSH48_16585 [Verrucomicrobiota bacterium]|jgi:hypothetical protein